MKFFSKLPFFTILFFLVMVSCELFYPPVFYNVFVNGQTNNSSTSSNGTNISYTVTFNANGGTGSMPAQSIAGGSTANLTANTFSRSGYSFVGWTNSTGTYYPDGASYTIGSANVTLYAQWVINGSYLVNFDANGGAGSMPAQTIASGATANLTANIFSQTGCTFTGWTNSAGTYYADGASFTMGTGNVVLYAEWSTTVSTIAGDGNPGWNDATGTLAQFSGPQGVAVDSLGNIYVADSGNNRIRKVTSAGVVTTLAGNGTSGWVDGPTNSAQFNNPIGIAVDSLGNVYVAEYGSNRIRKITISSGIVSTLAGDGTTNFLDGPTNSAKFNIPTGVAVDSLGNVYIADKGNNRIRMITISSGMVSTIAGDGNPGWIDAAGTSAEFNAPFGIAVNSSGIVYVADNFNQRIRIISNGIVTTLAGNTNHGWIDATGASAEFWNPTGVAVDSAGIVYVGDQQNQRIRKITPGGVVTTLAGDGNPDFLDGQGTSARFYYPYGIAIDSSGSIYIAEYGNHRIRKIR